ncbi:MAG TPA: helix-turn-helix transcriptional regulator [Patescibacteria group bacterium]|nr:helix-turn-helix transcriptional regulator [Patescibacteria group bacterium]
MKEYIINNVSDLRKEKDITQETFAHALGVSRQTVVAIEKGNYIPSLLLGIRIAQYFKKRVEDIFIYAYEK